MTFTPIKIQATVVSCLLLMLGLAGFLGAPAVQAGVTVENRGNLGVIKGIVRDHGGSPIADASVAIFRSGTSTLLKQVSSGKDGSFVAKILPGTYTVLAVAQGFNPVTLFSVQISPSSELTYGFRLERSGSGNTLPEKRPDRNSSKWRIRAAQMQRSIYQNQEGKTPIDDDLALLDNEDDTEKSAGKGQTVIETFVAESENGNYTGLNFATKMPVNEDAELVFAGQTGRGRNVPHRFETGVRLRPFEGHQVRVNTTIGLLGTVGEGDDAGKLGQVSFQALDEWKVSEGIIFVFGLDYSRFIGAGSDFSLSPRLGLQYDLNSKTRFRSAFTTQTDERSWANAIDLEGESFAFAEPVAVEDLVIESGKPLMNKSSRFEFGIERILDSKSSVDANVFFDTTISRGVGLSNLSFDPLGGESFSELVANQQGGARGIRVVYTRRLSGILSTSAGYSFGNGQQLSGSISDPSKIFESDYFQSFFGQVTADLKTGTSVRTIYRLSPQATVFAIDPFKGSLAIYDPGLSVYVTQSLPTFGLPLHAQAIVDARNIFDIQSGTVGEEGSLTFNSQRRMFRGGIQVRF